MSGLESDALVLNVVHEEIILLLNVADDAHVAGRVHGEAHGVARLVDGNKRVEGRDYKVGAREVDHHLGNGDVGDPRDVEAKCEAIGTSAVNRWVGHQIHVRLHTQTHVCEILAPTLKLPVESVGRDELQPFGWDGMY